MSTILFNRDSSFFNVEFTDYASGVSIAEKDVVSLSIVEESGKMPSGSLVLNDKAMVYSRILRPAAGILLSWGFKKANVTTDAPGSDIFSKNLERRGYRAQVLNPAGNAQDNGNYLYSCNFTALDWRGADQEVLYESGTKKDVVAQVFDRMQVPRYEILFDGMTDQYSTGYAERQAETDYAFLARLAYEWNVVLVVGRTQKGDRVGIFMAPQAIGKSALAREMSGNRGNKIEYRWGPFSKSPNVITYNWRNMEGENGAGDNVRIVYVNGKAVFQRFTVENDKVITWQLDPELVSEYLGHARASGGLQGEFQAAMAVQETTDFNDPKIKALFRPVEEKTAPNGLGYTVDLHCFGDPSVMNGMYASFADGFPDCLRERDGRPIKFINRRVTHTLSASGYFTDIEAVDFLAVSPTGLRA